MTRVVFVYSGEPYDVYIGRGCDPRTHQLPPFDWGNDWTHKEGTAAKFKVSSVHEAVSKFWEHCLRDEALILKIRRELKGKTLGCWCNSPKAKIKVRLPCHGDVLAQIAETEPCDCCGRGGLFDGHCDSGPAVFRCPKGCSCHD